MVGHKNAKITGSHLRRSDKYRETSPFSEIVNKFISLKYLRNDSRFLEWKRSLLESIKVPGNYLFPLLSLSQQESAVLGTGDDPMQEGAWFGMEMRGLQGF